MPETSAKTLPVSATCLFYPRGDTNRQGVAAIVTQSDPHGMLDLTYFVPNGRMVQVANGVRHKDDPWLKDRPEHARINGVWDFAENEFNKMVGLQDLMYGHNPATVQAESSDKLLLELRAKHGDGKSQQIAEEMTRLTGEAWNYQRVNIKLRNLRPSE